jgi:hypothetical protein
LIKEKRGGKERRNITANDRSIDKIEKINVNKYKDEHTNKSVKINNIS